MADIQKVIEGVDKVGTFANKYNGSIKEHIVSATLDGTTSILTLGKHDTDPLLVNLSQLNVITGLTYTEITTLKTDGELQIGKYYELFFNTIDCIDNTDTVYTGATETIYLLATSVNTFHHQVFSKQYPQDIIYYDIDNRQFDTHISSLRYDRSGYIYYRKDVIKNLEVDGYDFRTHIMKRYLVDSVNYNQYSASTVYVVGDYRWNTGVLYVCSVAHTSTASFNSFYWVKVLDSTYYNLPRTGSTTYGNTTLYASSTSITGYTFSTSSSMSPNIYNISISCYKNYNNFPIYTGSNYLYKPNIVIWGGICNNIIFDQDCYDITINTSTVNRCNFVGSGNLYIAATTTNSNFVNCNSIQKNGIGNNNNFLGSYNIYIDNTVDNNSIEYSNNIYIIYSTYNYMNQSTYTHISTCDYCEIVNSKYLYFFTANKNKLFNAESIKIQGTNNVVTDCTNLYLSFSTTGATRSNISYSIFTNSNFLYVTGTGGTNSYNEFTECSTINFNGSNNELKSCGTIGSLFNISGSTNTLSNCNEIYLTGSTNTLSNCNYVNLTGSQNNFYYCNAFGVRSGTFKSDYSSYGNNCSTFDTVGTGKFDSCIFSNGSANIWVLSGQTVYGSSFNGITTNTCFSGATVQNFNTITSNVVFSGINIGGTPYNGAGVITKTTISSSSFVGLLNNLIPVAISFSGGTTPYYTNLTAFA